MYSDIYNIIIYKDKNLCYMLHKLGTNLSKYGISIQWNTIVLLVCLLCPYLENYVRY